MNGFTPAPDFRSQPADAVLSELAFNKDGLVPVIAQDAQNGDVLMMAWMNADAVTETLKTGWVTYWSRSRQEYWRKGESSGHVQKLVEFQIDCDGDTILLKVDQTGPACHLGSRTCFRHRVENGKLIATSS